MVAEPSAFKLPSCGIVMQSCCCRQANSLLLRAKEVNKGKKGSCTGGHKLQGPEILCQLTVWNDSTLLQHAHQARAGATAVEDLLHGSCS